MNDQSFSDRLVDLLSDYRSRTVKQICAELKVREPQVMMAMNVLIAGKKVARVRSWDPWRPDKPFKRSEYRYKLL